MNKPSFCSKCFASLKSLSSLQYFYFRCCISMKHEFCFVLFLNRYRYNIGPKFICLLFFFKMQNIIHGIEGWRQKLVFLSVFVQYKHLTS